ncbi:hypothetical protein BX600DRAFT_450935 [Xylariales sp. PMI_506]|nr:hypothetical protein BX600DRAFT_450935 [Xylariales sp. PMI_506]
MATGLCPTTNANNSAPIPCGKVKFTTQIKYAEGPCKDSMNCQFNIKGHAWICCKCQSGENMTGFCSKVQANGHICSHTCCENCLPAQEQHKWLRLLP